MRANFDGLISFQLCRRVIRGLAIVAISVAALFVACRQEFPVRSYHYRLTIDMEKNGVIHSGYSVIELNTVSTSFWAQLDNIGAWETHPRGAAVFVDLDNGANVIALLRNDSSGSMQNTSILPSRVILGDEVAKRNTRSDILATVFAAKLSEVSGKTFHLRIDQLPPMICFRNIHDPTTVERVDLRNSTAGCGATFRFRDARLEITDDAVTDGISRRLAWLDQLKPRKSLNGPSINSGQHRL